MTRISTVTSVLACVMSVALWSAGATAQSTSPQPTNRSAPQAEQKAAQASKATQEYVQKAAVGDMFEVQSSNLAAKQAESSDVKAFAQRMIKDHTASTAALKSGIKSANLQPSGAGAGQTRQGARYQAERLAQDEGQGFRHRLYARAGRRP
jgi:predicted outer membrane protein